MISRIPFKKEYQIYGSAVLLVLAAYQLAFKKTIVAWQVNRHLQQQLSRSEGRAYLPGYQQRKNINLDKIIGFYRGDTLEFRSKILGDLSALAEKEGVKLSEVPAGGIFRLADGIIIQRLNFEGNYASLTKMLNALEHETGAGIVRSATFHTAKEMTGKEKTKNLLLECYFENIYK